MDDDSGGAGDDIFFKHKIKYPKYKDLIKSLFQFDLVRLSKLLHMAENATITAIFSFFAGFGINKLFDPKGEEEILEVVMKGLLQMITIIITVYYVRKLTKFIPFFLRLTSKYDPFHKSSDGEGMVGAAIAMSLLLMSTQTNMRLRIKRIIKEMDIDEKGKEEEEVILPKMIVDDGS